MASAVEAQVELETVGQAYQLRRMGSAGTAMLDRRRLTQMLRLSLYDLYREPDSPTRVYFVSSMRFDTDVGSYLGEVHPQSDRIAELKGAGELGRFELLHATLVAERLGGWVDAVLGRQILYDLYDFFAFDGGTVRVHSPWHFSVEGLAGFEVRGSSPLASPIYELDGTSLGSTGAASCYQLAIGAAGAARGCPSAAEMLSPTYGFSMETAGIEWLQARVAYRRTQSGTPYPLAGIPDSGVRDEKISVTTSLRWGLLRPYGGFRYSLLHGFIDQADAGVRMLLGRGHSLSVQYLFSSPTFDGDSIFNVFASQPIDDIRVNFSTAYFGAWRFWNAGFARFAHDLADDLAGPGTAKPFGSGSSAGLNAGVQRQLSGRGYFRLDGYYEDGMGGRRTGADGSARVDFSGGKWSLEGRLTLVYFEPEVGGGAADFGTAGVDRSAVSFGMQSGVRYALADQANLHMLFENNHNRYYPYQLRVIGVLEVGFWR